MKKITLCLSGLFAAIAIAFGASAAQPVANAVILPPAKTNPIAWGYDLKNPPAAAGFNAALATGLFNEDGMTIIRVPILCNYYNESDCSLQENNKYWVAAMKAAKTAMKIKPDVKVFASLRIEGIYGVSVDGKALGTFPAWAYNGDADVKNNPKKGYVKADVYTDMLANYLVYMKKNGVPVDYLGIDNEPEHSCTGFDRNFDLYITVLDGLKAKAAAMGFDMPKQFVAPEPIGPKPEHIDFVKYLIDKTGRGDLITILGTHYYPIWRYNNPKMQARLGQMVAAAKGRPFWMTEAHYDDLEHTKKAPDWTELDRANLFMVTNFDLFDLGCSGYFVWDYKRDDSNKKGSICRELAQSTAGYTSAPVNINLNPDGTSSNAVDRGFNIRAFVDGKAVSVWITNIRDVGAATDVTKKDYSIAVDGNTIKKIDSYLVWNDACWTKSPYSAISGPAARASRDGKNITFTIPDRCMALLKFRLN